jgi:hypothetical protein
VETIQKEAKKAALAGQEKGSGNVFTASLQFIDELAEMNK